MVHEILFLSCLACFLWKKSRKGLESLRLSVEIICQMSTQRSNFYARANNNCTINSTTEPKDLLAVTARDSTFILLDISATAETRYETKKMSLGITIIVSDPCVSLCHLPASKLTCSFSTSLTDVKYFRLHSPLSQTPLQKLNGVCLS